MYRLQNFIFLIFVLFTISIFNTSNALANSDLYPRGTIDEPIPGSTIKEPTNIRGWVLDGNGVSKIEILIDGKVIGQAQYGDLRSDVQMAYPQYQNANSGFHFTLDPKQFTNGKHTLTIRETGNNGQSTDIQSVAINIQNKLPIGTLDEPLNNAVITNITNVRGWVLDGSGVSKVEVLLDGKVIGDAQYGIQRLDVYAAYPQFNNKNSGFTFSLDPKKIPNGKHTLAIRGTGNNGAQTDIFSKTITIQNPEPKGVIDEPLNGTLIKSSTTVRGWYLDGSGVNKVDVLFDGQVIGQAQYGKSRTDVQNAYPIYKNSNSGFEFNLDPKKFTNGKHKLTIKGTGNNGVSTEIQTVEITIQNPEPRGLIDEPAHSSVVKDVTNVRGWALDVGGVSKVEVLVDGKVLGNAQYGLTRNDVNTVYPEYQNTNSGFQFSLDTRSLTNGLHSLSIREYSQNGSSRELNRVTINVQNPPAIGNIDEPNNESTTTETLNVRGWFVDYSGISRVEVLVDGNVIGQAQYGISRPDVRAAYPAYQNDQSGYQFQLDPKNFSTGQHTLSVRGIGNNGQITLLPSRKINFQTLSPKGVIDEPSNNSTVKGTTSVRGWYVDGSSVSKIEILVDGKLLGQANYGSARSDILAAYPAYKNGNSGFQYSLDTTQFPDGEHTITVKETGVNGGTSSISTKIFISNGNPYTVLNLMKPSKITANDIVDFFNRRYPTSPLKNYAQSFIDAQNRYGVNAQYLVAHAIWETGWGGSDLKTYKNNLFGYGAYDVCPFTCGYYFPSGADSILKVAYQVRRDYLESSGTYYNGPTLTGMNVRYATDQNWKNGISNLMASIKAYDYAYYNNANPLSVTDAAPPEYGRDIPAGKPYPTNTVINYPSGKIATVNTSGLSFRSLPYVSTSTYLRSLDFGTTVIVLGYNTDVRYDPASTGNYAYRWYRVSVNGTFGWLYGKYLTITN